MATDDPHGVEALHRRVSNNRDPEAMALLIRLYCAGAIIADPPHDAWANRRAALDLCDRLLDVLHGVMLGSRTT